MINSVCDECLNCYNYHVSELGCWGSSSPCNSYVGDDEDDNFSDDDDTYLCGCCKCCGCDCDIDELDNEDWDLD